MLKNIFPRKPLNVRRKPPAKSGIVSGLWDYKDKWKFDHKVFVTKKEPFAFTRRETFEERLDVRDPNKGRPEYKDQFKKDPPY